MCYDRDTKKKWFFSEKYILQSPSPSAPGMSMLNLAIRAIIACLLNLWVNFDCNNYVTCAWQENIQTLNIWKYFTLKGNLYIATWILYKITNVKPINFIGKMIELSSKNRRCVHELLLHDNISSIDNPLGNWLI